MDSYNSPSTKPLYRGTQIIWYIFGIIEILLLFRFFLKLLGANSTAVFTNFIYDITHIFVAPFFNVFGAEKVLGSTFELATILAMLTYWILTIGLIKLLLMGKTVSTPEAAVKLDNQ